MQGNRPAALPAIMPTGLLAPGCSGTPSTRPGNAGTPAAPPTTEPRAATNDLRRSIAELALSMVGAPYRYGGADPSAGFDCSGLVYYTYSSEGLSVPRTSRAQLDAP